MTTVHLDVRGAFDLRQSAEFGFGQRHGIRYAGTMTLAFCLDGYSDHAVVVLRPEPGGVAAEVVLGEPELAARQAARVLSLDVDARGYDALGATDDLVGRLQGARPGLRPPLFHSVYEAAAWSVISARRPQRQAALLRERLSQEHGRVVDVGGATVAAFPTPDQLLGVTGVPGLPEVALRRLHAVAEEARGGGLDTERLRSRAPGEAAARVRRLPGIGPFYAELVVVRALGHTDVLPRLEPRVRELAGALRGEHLDEERFGTVAEAWQPWRTWVAVALRAAGPRLLADEPGGPGGDGVVAQRRSAAKQAAMAASTSSRSDS
jgi:DNA-3-methyladenine glycosylase II